MNEYKAFYKGKEIEIEAVTSLEAQRKAAEIFKAKKAYDVTVGLCVLNVDTNKPREVIHVATF